MWTKLHDDFDIITPEQLGKHKLNSSKVNEKDNVQHIKDKFMELGIGDYRSTIKT